MTRYLTDLARVIRDAGLVVHEEPGWQTRARSSGGYADGHPSHVVVHHTASRASRESDVAYIAHRSDIAPIANLYLARDGSVTVIAAGACNHAGKGGPLPGVPADGMNARSIGIEAGNDGVGEPWPDVQQDAYVILVHALCDAYRIPIGNVVAHREWAPSRKIDPAGPSRWADRSGRWDMDRFRGDILVREAATSPQLCPTCGRPL